MELAYFVYIGLLVLLLFFSITEVQLTSSMRKYSKKTLFHNPYTFIPILLFSILIGLRYDVGFDYMAYKKDYDSLINPVRVVDLHFEIGYEYIFRSLAYIGASYIWPFLVTAFLQIYCIYYQSRKNIFLLPFIIFFYITTSNFMYSLNIMRQILAFNILFVGTTSIIDKKIYKWLGFCFVASLFHITALIALPFYFLNKNFIKNKYLPFIVLPLIYFVFEYLFVTYFEVFFNKYIPFIMSGVDSEVLARQDREIVRTSGSGIFAFALFVVYCLFIFNYKQCFKFYNKYGFVLFFNLSVIGIIMQPLVVSNILLDRIVYYFYGFRFVTFAFYFHYFFLLKKNIFISIIMIIFMILLFVQFLVTIGSGSNGISPFQFVTDL